MLRRHRLLKNVLLTVLVMLAAFAVCLVLQDVGIGEQVTALFVFAVFLISLFTDGYWYGLLASAVGILAVNFVFTFPYFAFNFTIVENLLSALAMLIISLFTSMLTTRLKRWEVIRKEGELEIMRANLLRAVSHDIRTPLTTIYGASSAMLENYGGLSDVQKEKLLGGIKEDAEWLIRMVENLLSVTKLDGGLRLFKTPTVPEELIESVYAKFQKRYPLQTVHFELPDEMVRVPMDALLIEQVLVNLLENAVQHAKGMTRLDLAVRLEGGKAHFLVFDDGCGVEKERLSDIFKGNISTKEAPSDSKKRNAGIGLSVCASIIKAHNGRIFAKNRKEGGALFGFSLDTEVQSDEQ